MKGLAPIIATVLVISFTIAVGAVVALWGTGFLTESTQKVSQNTQTVSSCTGSVFGINYVRYEVGPDRDMAGWSSRSTINLTGQGTQLYNYQEFMNLTVPVSQVNHDFTDLRIFYLNPNTSVKSEVPYWIQGAQLDSSDFYIGLYANVTAVPASGNATLYAYWGNPSVSSFDSLSDNGTATFIFFDDFGSGLSKWTRSPSGGISDIADGTLNISVTGLGGYNTEGRTSVQSVYSPYRITMMQNVVSDFSNANGIPNWDFHPPGPTNNYISQYGTGKYYYNGTAQIPGVIATGWRPVEATLNGTHDIISYNNTVNFTSRGGQSSGKISLSVTAYDAASTVRLQYDNVTVSQYYSPSPAYHQTDDPVKTRAYVTATYLSGKQALANVSARVVSSDGRVTDGPVKFSSDGMLRGDVFSSEIDLNYTGEQSYLQIDGVCGGQLGSLARCDYANKCTTVVK